jgi:1-acyl-sn-glycerol-3-phosphate acyltransferase
MRWLMHVTVGVVLVAASASTASAQFAASFDQLVDVTKPGQTLLVIDREGNESRGRLVRVSDGSITLALKRGAREFAADEVIVIRRPDHDSVLNGAAIGGAITAGMVAITFASCDNCSGFFPLVVGNFVVGAGLGALVDAFILTPRDIYRVGKPRIDVRPMVGGTSRGAQVVLRW